jgi:acetate kinase
MADALVVLNAGSSSLKFSVFVDDERRGFSCGGSSRGCRRGRGSSRERRTAR